MRILSGIQPSGDLHIGNYFGMMKRMIEYQETDTLFCFIVNYHALTSVFDAERLRQQTFDAACDFLALGIDPEKAIFWIQSDVPEVTELTWILSNATSMGLLERCHSYKDKISKGLIPNHGLFAYPVLMAADILLFGAQLVPVGKDQKQHVEITRDIALRFNSTYGETFVIPDVDIPEHVAKVPGLDGEKMSKSYNNTIPIFSTEKQLRKKIMAIKTDTIPVEAPKDPDNSVLFDIYSLFLSQDEQQELRHRFLTPGLMYGHVKQELFEKVWEYFAPYRAKRQEYADNPNRVREILKYGAEKARAVGSEYLEKARHNVGLLY
ncbi:tryptophan--tRNA ligase [candidate division KSB3 bacterium]|uniref:Tryptophan--tRNA ligase n=1 Tax=candidate division KSB3 bacterium TaxID=2044937 RepID=A0A2G6E499_9BACT|nr:MAG: tryptophan--tRNA ligase [candidate division KSB3 bacterium]PIE29329.1 MAG: tryptophan--tRNA ligase [candidate division KSB3 bacterium]